MSGHDASASVVEDVMVGGKATRTNPQKKETTNARIARVELAVGEHQDALSGIVESMEDLQEKVKGLEQDNQDLKGEVQGVINELAGSLRGEFASMFSEQMAHIVQEEVAKQTAELRGHVQALTAQLTEAKTDLALYRAAVAGTTTIREAPKIRVPEPTKYNGKRDSKEIDNFLWGLEQYFDALKITEDDMKIKSATMYLAEDAILWWRRRQADEKKGLCHINTWDDFKGDFKKQFYPDNAEEIALKKLRALKHMGSIREYVKQYSSLLLEIEDMPEHLSFLYFMDGLQRWAEQELKRRNVKTLAEAINVAESLYKLKTEPRRDRFVKKSGNKEKGGGATTPSSSGASTSRFSKYKDKGKAKETSFSDSKLKNRDCFLCGGPHFVRDCPQKQKLNAMASAYDEKTSSEDEARMGSLRLLNKIAKEKPKVEGKPTKLDVLPRSSGLIFVEAVVNEKRTKSLFDCGATHNFVTKEEATRLGLKYHKEGGSMKAVNSSSMPIHGVVRKVPLRLGEWKGNADFTVVNMDDYAMVLGMEFIDSVRPLAFEKDGSLTITSQGNARSIPVTREQVEAKTLSALQLKKGIKHVLQFIVLALPQLKLFLSRAVRLRIQDYDAANECNDDADHGQDYGVINIDTTETTTELNPLLIEMDKVVSPSRLSKIPMPVSIIEDKSNGKTGEHYSKHVKLESAAQRTVVQGLEIGVKRGLGGVAGVKGGWRRRFKVGVIGGGGRL
ncbi:hypothetical protein KSS87_020161 [Heliosperma pusillum]|nr:hypothetical protein KSS87_020161 [Heliosperma pusillum]